MTAVTLRTVSGVLDISQSLAIAARPTDYVMAKAVAEVLRRSQGMTSGEQAALTDLRNSLVACETAKDLGTQLLLPAARKHGVDRLVSNELAAGRLALMPYGLAEVQASGRRTLLQDTAIQLARDFSNGNEDHLDTFRSVLGRSADLPDVSKLLIGVDADRVHQWLDTGKVDDDEMSLLGDVIVEQLQGHLRNDLPGLSGYVTEAEQLFGSLKEASPPLSSEGKLSAHAIRGMGTSLTSFLRLTGNYDAASQVGKAVAYVEAGYQLYQSAAMLAAATTGWGAAVAVLGIVNSGSSLQLLGGSSGNADASQAVLKALAGLGERMDRQFERVNKQLHGIAQGINALFKKLDKVQGDVEETLRTVRSIEATLNYLLVRGATDVRLLAYLIQSEQHLECESFVTSETAPSRQELSKCMAFYSSEVCARASREPMQLELEGESAVVLTAAFGHLEDSFGPAGDAKDMWACALPLATVLHERFSSIPAAPVKPVHWPSVGWALDMAAQLRTQEGQKFDELKDDVKRKVVLPMREALQTHALFSRYLRGPEAMASVSEHPILGPLLGELEFAYEQAAEFASTFRSKAAADIARRIHEGEQDIAGFYFPRVDPPVLHNDDGVPDTTWDMLFGGGNVQYWEQQPSHLFDTLVGDRDPMDGNAPEDEFSFEVPLRVEVVDLMREPWYGGTPEGPTQATLRFKYYGEWLADGYLVDVQLHFDHDLYDPAENPPSDPVDFISVADGIGQSAGSEAFGAKAGEMLAEEDVIASALEKLTARLETRERLTMLYVAEQLANLDESEWGPGLELRRTLGYARKVAITIRAVCRLGFEDAYKALDPLASLFDGGLDTRLMDKAFLPAWARAVREAGPYTVHAPDPGNEAHRMALKMASSAFMSGVIPLGDIAQARLGHLKKALDVLVQSASFWGRPFELQRVEALFKDAFSDVD